MSYQNLYSPLPSFNSSCIKKKISVLAAVSQYFYAIRTSCHLFSLTTGFTRGVITSWYQCECGFVAVFGTLHVSSPYHQPCFGFSAGVFICHPGTADTLGPGMPSPWLVLLGAGSCPTLAQAGESFGEEDAGSREPWPPVPPCILLCRDAAASPVKLPSLSLTLAPGSPGAQHCTGTR